MQDENFVEKIATLLGQNASVKNVYGEPIVTQDKTIIPVAQIAFGFGGGFGQKLKKNTRKPAAGAEKEPPPEGKGAGGGGGMYARPKGVYEVTANGTRFIPANNMKQMLAAVLCGILIGGWIALKKKK